jgi:hypothetical protein
MLETPTIDDLHKLLSFFVVKIDDNFYDLVILQQDNSAEEQQVACFCKKLSLYIISITLLIILLNILILFIKVRNLSEIVQDLISDIVPRVLGVWSAYLLLQKSTESKSQAKPLADQYNWLYKWTDFLACLLNVMSVNSVDFENNFTLLLQTVRFVTGEDAILSNFSQFKLQQVK